MGGSEHGPSFPLSLEGEGFPPRSCASVALRKSHGGKGEGVHVFDAASRLTPHRERDNALACSPKGRAEKGKARDDDTNAVMLRCARKGASLKRCTLFILPYIKI